MTTWIPFGLPTGNNKTISSEVFSPGQQIFVKTTGTYTGSNPVTNSPLVEDSAAKIIASSIPLNPATTTYGMHGGEYLTNTTTGYQPMAWVTFQADDFTNAGLVLNGTQPSNPIGTQAAADTYEDFLYNTSVTRLTAQGCQDGTPICIDPEDLGFDKALFYHDIYRSWKTTYSGTSTNSFANNLNPYDYDGTTGSSYPGVDIDVAAPLIIQVMSNVKARLNSLYPNSPVGFYSVGSAAFWLTGWSGVYVNSTNTSNSLHQSYQIMEDVFDANLADTPGWWGWQALGALDFVFNAYYPALDDAGKMPFVRYGSKLEVLKNFLHLFVDKFSGTAQGAKMMIGISVRANVAETDLSGASLIYADTAKNNGTLTVPGEPVEWFASTATYPAFNSVPKLTDNTQNSDFVYTPMSMQSDLVKWMNLLPGTSSTAGFQSSPAGASPASSQGDLTALTESLRDFPMAIWDGGYITLYNGVAQDLYGPTLSDNEVKTFRSLYTKQTIMDAYSNSGQTTDPYGPWLATQMDADAASYISLFTSKGDNTAWYSAT